MNNPIRIRCSRLPAIAACGQAAFPPAVHVDSEHDVTREGSAIHEWMKQRLTTEPDATIFPIGRKHGCEDMTSLRRLAYWTWDAWRKLQVHFPAPEAETSMEFVDDRYGIVLTGTADLIAMAPGNLGRLNILDWKSGWLDSDAEQQLRGYAWLALQNSDADEVKAVIPRPRLGVIDGYPEDREAWTRAELAEWWDNLAAKLRASPGYNPGFEQCRYCPRWLECDAAKAEVRAAKDWMLQPGGTVDDVVALSSEQLVALHWQEKALEKALETVGKVKRIEVARRGGSVQADGWELFIKQEEQRPVNVRRALPLLEDALGENLADCLTFTKSKAEKIIGGKEMNALERRLEEEGALGMKTIQKLMTRRSNDSGKAAISATAGAGVDGATE